MGEPIPKHIVYKYVFKDEIIYIGKSSVGANRLSQHGKPGDNIKECYWDEINNSDVFYAEMANDTMADVYESELIRRYSPKCNVAKKNVWSGIHLPEPVWVRVGNPESKRELALLGEVNKLIAENKRLKETVSTLQKAMPKVRHNTSTLEEQAKRIEELLRQITHFKELYEFYMAMCDSKDDLILELNRIHFELEKLQLDRDKTDFELAHRLGLLNWNELDKKRIVITKEDREEWRRFFQKLLRESDGRAENVC